MYWKAFLIWLFFMVGAIANGTLRVKVIVPFTGEAIGHIISTVLLCVIILSITWYALPWVAPGTRQQAWGIGACWLLLTLAFEFGVGYFISHHTWPEMLADYNVLKGRVWVAVPIITFLAPWWMANLRHLLP
ncbi:MAG: hypothetical protein KDC01_11305 [Flavobacteriales bacterium]|jgi:hypothetical protein|nr:hypothetical protein [Flavobacteriales bacterium]